MLESCLVAFFIGSCGLGCWAHFILFRWASRSITWVVVSVLNKNFTVLPRKRECMASIHPYLRGMQEAGGGKNAIAGRVEWGWDDLLSPLGSGYLTSGEFGFSWISRVHLGNAVVIAEPPCNCEERVLPLAPCRHLQMPSRRRLWSKIFFPNRWKWVLGTCRIAIMSLSHL